MSFHAVSSPFFRGDWLVDTITRPYLFDALLLFQNPALLVVVLHQVGVSPRDYAASACRRSCKMLWPPAVAFFPWHLSLSAKAEPLEPLGSTASYVHKVKL